MNRLRSADADHDFFFQHAQQLGLAAEAQVADLVEKQRAAGGQLELALAAFVGVGEGPFLVAEQFAFQQRFGNRRAVDGDERLVAAAAEVVNRLADDFLAGAVFAQDQNRPDRCRPRGESSSAGPRSPGFRRSAARPRPPVRRCAGGARAAARTAACFPARSPRAPASSTSACFVVGGEIAGELVDHLERAEQFAARCRAAARTAACGSDSPVRDRPGG